MKTYFKDIKIFLESLDVINLLARIYPSPFQISLNSTPFIVIYEPSQVKVNKVYMYKIKYLFQVALHEFNYIYIIIYITDMGARTHVRTHTYLYRFLLI